MKTFRPAVWLAAASLTACALLSFSAPAAAQVPGGRLPTRWDKDINPAHPLPEYPRPQMTRLHWQSLNGPWQSALTDKTAMSGPAAYTGKILVPFPYESALSGGSKASIPDQKLWCRRTFTVPAQWRTNGQRVLLHFGAVNWDSMVSVNGKKMGEHIGGYDGFDYDITDSLKPGVNTLVVSALNPLIADAPEGQVLGKQRLHPQSIFYTAATGIWQSVWLEPVPAAHIASLQITPDIDAKAVRVAAQTEHAPGAQVKLTVRDAGRIVATVTGAANAPHAVPLGTAKLWSPDTPHLYTLQVSLLRDGKTVDTTGSYFALRKVSLGKDAQGRTTILLNNKPLLEIGALDQGYWPDGIYTAPTDAALRSDIDVAKRFGFNLLRKHAKVEPERWYYWTDKLGMLVWQDMPQAFGKLNDDAKAQWLVEWKREIATHRNHPSIIVWTTFNEGWGEDTFDVPQIVALTHRLDPTRLVNDASGWNDKAVGDIRDTHAYPGPGSEKPEVSRAAVNGEFGGVTRRVSGHMWTTDVVGYGTTLDSSQQVTRRYQQLLKAAYGLRHTKGTCAFVYTQLTDVEQESNGLLTYDRSIIKADPAIVRAANLGRFPLLPPDPDAANVLVPTSQDDGQTYRYITDKPSDNWTALGFDDAAWKTGPGVFGHDAANIRTPWTSPDIWLRRTVTLPAALPAKINVLALHDEDVEVYINGVLAAQAPGFTDQYAVLPLSDAARSALKPGAANLIAVHCHQTVGGQSVDIGLVKAK